VPRVKRGTHRRASRKKTLNQASGYFLTKSKLYRAAQEAVERGLKFAYVGRKNKKREFRSLWIVRINAACREAGISYSRRSGIEPQGSGGRGPSRRCRVSPAGRYGQDGFGEGMSPAEQELDSLSSLEDRIQKAVQLVGRLRQEKDAALAEAADAKAEVERLTGEVNTLQTERKQVRNRIEKLLGQIDQLGPA
jgi:ribosomal protein L20